MRRFVVRTRSQHRDLPLSTADCGCQKFEKSVWVQICHGSNCRATSPNDILGNTHPTFVPLLTLAVRYRLILKIRYIILISKVIIIDIQSVFVYKIFVKGLGIVEPMVNNMPNYINFMNSYESIGLYCMTSRQNLLISRTAYSRRSRETG